MKITVEDRRPVSAEVTVEMVEAYLRRTGWTMAHEVSEEEAWARGFRRGDDAVTLMSGLQRRHVARVVEGLAAVERRQPSEVLSDIVGYQVGLDRGRASVLRNSASAHVVDAREALAAAETAQRARPQDRSRAAAVETARARLAQAEAELAAATRALEAARVAEGQP
ncbi:hypothetical protein [Sorangium sp. So ce1024]|uniref:hypothetical protein n=1 Tax=Sorangium sp. So ce1024 TaxID=3133327 RepID=UPI003F1138E6